MTILSSSKCLFYLAAVLVGAQEAESSSNLTANGSGYYANTTSPGFDRKTINAGLTGDNQSKTVTINLTDGLNQPQSYPFSPKSFSSGTVLFGRGTVSYGSFAGSLSAVATSDPPTIAQTVNPPDPSFPSEAYDDLFAEINESISFEFDDGGVVTSTSLPAGSAVTLHFVVFNRYSGYFFGEPPYYADASLNAVGIGEGGYFSYFDSGTGNGRDGLTYFQNGVQSYAVNTFVGARIDFSMTFGMSVVAAAGGNNSANVKFYPTDVEGQVNASKGANLYIATPPGVSFNADSGHSYVAPQHPPSFQLSPIALIGATHPPGSQTTFASLNTFPSITGNNITFWGMDSAGKQGVYVANGLNLSTLVDTNTSIPGGAGNFNSFAPNGIPGDPCIAGNQAAFAGTGTSSQQGIYRVTIPSNPTIPPSLVKMADTNTAIPSGTGNFTGFGLSGIPIEPCVSGDNVTFFGTGSSSQRGIYAQLGGTLLRIADLNTAIPHGTGTFTDFSTSAVFQNPVVPPSPVISGDTVALIGFGSNNQQGIYKSVNGGALTKVADANTAIPSGSGNFANFASLAIDPADPTNLAFVAGNGKILNGIYASLAGAPLARIADSTMPMPGTGSNFAAFDSVAIDPGNLAFVATSVAGDRAIIARINGQLVNIVAVSDYYNGNYISDLHLSRTGFNEVGGTPRITFRADFADGSSGIFSAIAGPPGQLGNISTRSLVQTGDNTMIGGFIIGGTGTKQVLIRALGPTLTQFNVQGALANPGLNLYDGSGVVLAANDDWEQASNAQSIPSNYRPPSAEESAILTSLASGNYTAIVRGIGNTTGVALIEVYDLDGAGSTSTLSNISTRSFVQSGNNVMIAGVIVQGTGDQQVLIRGLGPTLGQAPFNVPSTLADPKLSLRDVNGNNIATNDNWKDDNETAIAATGKAPPNNSEPAIIQTLPPGNYTAILGGVNGTTGNALVEVYTLP